MIDKRISPSQYRCVYSGIAQGPIVKEFRGWNAGNRIFVRRANMSFEKASVAGSAKPG